MLLILGLPDNTSLAPYDDRDRGDSVPDPDHSLVTFSAQLAEYSDFNNMDMYMLNNTSYDKCSVKCCQLHKSIMSSGSKSSRE